MQDPNLGLTKMNSTQSHVNEDELQPNDADEIKQEIKKNLFTKEITMEEDTTKQENKKITDWQVWRKKGRKRVGFFT